MHQYLKISLSQINLSINQQTFAVYELDGEEALSQLFQFNITLLLPLATDFNDAMNTSAQLSITNNNNYKRDISGIITQIRHAGLFDTQQISLCIQLQPLLTRLTLAKSLQFFHDQTVIDVIKHMLLTIGYRIDQIKFVCIYKYSIQTDIAQVPNENDYQFFQRLLAQAGLFYWLNTEQQQEVIYFCDNNQSYITLITDKIFYLPPTNLMCINDTTLTYGYFYQMQINSSLVTNSFSMRHFNPDINTETIEVNNDIDPQHLFKFQIYSHLSDNLEALKLEAMLRATRAKVDSYNLSAQGNVNLLSPGQIINLNAQNFQNNNNYDNQYLIIKLNHHATQSSDQFGSGTAISYNNEAILIPKSTSYCDNFPNAPQSPACWIGHVQSNDIYPNLDNAGNYYVHPHYNANQSINTISGNPINRMAYFGGIGNQYAIGKHWPLNNNTEVLLSCFNNNFNQPLIIGALPNYIFKSPVTSMNNTQNKIITQQNNLMLFEDRLDEQKIQLATKDSQNILELNASYDKNVINIISQQGQLNLNSHNDLTLQCDNSLIEKCGRDWALTTTQNCIIKSNNSSISYQADNNLLFKSNNNILINAKNNVEITSNDKFILRCQSASIQCNSSIDSANNGNIIINCVKSISLINLGNNKIQLLNQECGCEIAADGTIYISGNIIRLTGAEIFINGMISK